MSNGTKSNDPFQQGVNAYLAGKSISSNPYSWGSYEYMNWKAGWRQEEVKAEPGITQKDGLNFTAAKIRVL